MRVLFCVIPERGHINPYIGPAQALRSLGAEVAFHADADISAQLAAAGITQFLGPRGERPPDAHRGAELAAKLADSEWLRAWIKALLVDAAEAGIEPLRAVIRGWNPDVLVIDPMVYAAAIAAQLESVPWAAVSNSLNPVLPDHPAHTAVSNAEGPRLDSELLRTVEWLGPDRAALFARHGMNPAFRGCDVMSPHLTIAFTTHELVDAPEQADVRGGRETRGAGDTRGDARGAVRLVGPSLPHEVRGDEIAFPWEWLDGRPLVYASFGSQIFYQPKLFRCLIDAVTGRDVQLVISASDLATSGELGVLPDNVIARPYVPQLALLRRASAFVTHGGANSVMEAIAAGVPLLIAPLCNDQFHQVYFVERAGIGHSIEPATTTSDIAWRAISELLDRDGPARAAMNRVSASYQRDGAAEAARLIRDLGERAR